MPPELRARTFLPVALPQPAPRPRVIPFPKPYRPRPDPEEQAQIDQVPFRHRPRLPRSRLLHEVLLDQGDISPSDLAWAMDQQARHGGSLREILLAEGLLPEPVLLQALASQTGLGYLDRLPPADPVNLDLARRLPTALAVEHLAIPIRQIGGHTLIVTARPDRLSALQRALPPALHPANFAIAPRADIEERLTRAMGQDLARRAECSPPRQQSCRDWQRSLAGWLIMGLLTIGALSFLLAPGMALQVVTLAGLVAMVLTLGLKVAAVYAMWPGRGPEFLSDRALSPPATDVPCITLLVALHREPEILPALLRRMEALVYPRAALELLLVIEEDDHATRDALTRIDLPPWMRPVIVPEGQPRTKPRALNYALNFARGRIVGIYDAEDAPEPDQLLKVAGRFASAPPDLACLQGQLDYYNPTRNWMARCFTVEYANWFRLMLPGLARLGLVVPLGGTTLFFRKAALMACGAWDAHNVTEDADLGVRLARMGYRTGILRTTTFEEANAAPLAWVKQRSRWIKGYVMTWAVHSAHPASLWRDLGPKRFFGFHLQFLGSVLNALFLPFMWSTLLLAFGWSHPVLRGLPDWCGPVLAGSMPALTALMWGLSWYGCSSTHHKRLRPWIPTMEIYWPLATIASCKALIELVLRPFHWDKTAHGAFGGVEIEVIAQPQAVASPRRFAA